jgi:transposase
MRRNQQQIQAGRQRALDESHKAKMASLSSILPFDLPTERLTVDRAWELYRDHGYSQEEIAEMFHIDPRSITYRLRQVPRFAELAKDRLYFQTYHQLPEYSHKRARRYVYKGERLTLPQWAARKGVSKATAYRWIVDNEKSIAEFMEHDFTRDVIVAVPGLRLDFANLPKKKLFGREQPILPLISFNGETHGVAEWARKCGIHVVRMYTRLRSWTIIDALTRTG